MTTQEILYDLQKLHSLPTPSSSSKKPTIPTSLTPLSTALAASHARLLDGEDPAFIVNSLLGDLEKARKGVDGGLREWYAALGKVGKGIEKRFPTPLAPLSNTYDHLHPPPPSTFPSSPPLPLFSDPASSAALDTLIAHHLARTGEWGVLEVLEREVRGARGGEGGEEGGGEGGMVEDKRRQGWMELGGIVGDLKEGRLDSAISWVSRNHAPLTTSHSPLPFHLHRSQYLLHLLSSPTPHTALSYARDHLFPYLPTHSPAIYHLLGALLYTPAATQLPGSPYADLLGEEYRPERLVGEVEREWCRLNGEGREGVLAVVVEVGAGGGLGRIEKGRKVVEGRLGPVRNWQEMPMELPLPNTRRYHSIFACPVAKEQSTEQNPPKMLSCGHVIASESLSKLSKHGRRAVKCPYCPAETAISSAKRLYF